MYGLLAFAYMLPGRWEVVSAPAEAEAGSEAAPGIEIILRHPAAAIGYLLGSPADAARPLR